MKKSNMELVDYTGKLNEYDKYIEMLNRLKRICKYIDIAFYDEKPTPLLCTETHEGIVFIRDDFIEESDEDKVL